MMRKLMILVVVATLGGCGSLDPVGWWPDNTKSDRPAELVELERSVSAHILWTASVGDGRDEYRVNLVPYVHKGRLYAAEFNGTVKALNADTGAEIWSVDTELEISGGPGAGEGLVLLGTSNAEVVALDANNGSERWRARVSSEVLSVPKAAQGMVVVHTIDGKLFGLSAETGERVWLHDRTTPVLTLHGISSPVISGTQVICGFSSGKLAALDLISGDLLWEVGITAPHGRSELERMVDIDGDPLVRDGVIFVASFQGELAAVGEDTGVVLWRRKLSSYTGLSADWRQLYITDEEDHVWAIDPKNGDAFWKQDKMHGRRLTSPAVLGEYLIIGDYEGYLHWLSLEDGSLVGRERVGSDPITTAPIVVDGVLYVLRDGGGLAAITLPSMAAAAPAEAPAEAPAP